MPLDLSYPDKLGIDYILLMSGIHVFLMLTDIFTFEWLK